MDLKYKVCLEYLNKQAASNIPENQLSKEDKAKQTVAVEKLLKNIVSEKLPEYKDKIFSVGGHVRDQLLGKQSKDLDIVVDDPKQKMKSAEIFSRKMTNALGITTGNNPHPLNKDYGIWGVVLFNPKEAGGSRKPFIYDGVDVTGYIIELTPPRKEGPYIQDLDDKEKTDIYNNKSKELVEKLEKSNDPKERKKITDELERYKDKLFGKGSKSSRSPAYVDYTSREEDAKRRDLTINALYKNMVTDEIEDHVGGIKDLRNKNLRPPEHPEGIEKVYEEDPLRVLRLIRFQGKLGDFKVSPETMETVKNFLSTPKGDKAMRSLSKERIRDEFTNILTHPNAAIAVKGMEIMRDYDLLKFLSSDLDRLTDMYHDTVYHKGESIWEHTMDVLSRTPPTLKARLGALFHDIGKLETQEKDTDAEGKERVHFIGHENKSAQMVNKILQDLKFPTSVAKSVSDIVHAHMGFKNIGQQKPKTQLRNIRIFIEKLYDDLDEAIALLKADAGHDPHDIQTLNELEKRIRAQIKDDLDKGLLVQKQKGMAYIDPLTGDEIQQEYEQIKKEGLGAVKKKLKEMLLKGCFEADDSEQRCDRAKKLIKNFAGTEQQLQATINKYQKERKSEKFFKS